MAGGRCRSAGLGPYQELSLRHDLRRLQLLKQPDRGGARAGGQRRRRPPPPPKPPPPRLRWKLDLPRCLAMESRFNWETSRDPDCVILDDCFE